jgi:hypothetical protein
MKPAAPITRFFGKRDFGHTESGGFARLLLQVLHLRNESGFFG